MDRGSHQHACRQQVGNLYSSGAWLRSASGCQIKPYSTLIFTVELKSIEKPVETKPATEADSNKNAETAKKAKAAIAKRKIMKKK